MGAEKALVKANKRILLGIAFFSPLQSARSRASANLKKLKRANKFVFF